MTVTLSFVTTGTALVHAIAEKGRERRDDDDATAARAWIARQWRFERWLRTLEEETSTDPANPSSDSK